MAPREDKTVSKDIILLLLGAFLAVIGGALTSWLSFKLQNNAADYKTEIDRQSVLAGFQAEVEVNLFKLNNRFSRYEKIIESDSELIIYPNNFTTSVFDSNLSQIGKVGDLALIAELVSFYDALKSVDIKALTLRNENQINEQDKRIYVSELANFLHAGIYLQGRMKNSISELPRKITEPKFSEDQMKLLERIKNIRGKLGAHKVDSPLRFHPSP